MVMIHKVRSLILKVRSGSICYDGAGDIFFTHSNHFYSPCPFLWSCDPPWLHSPVFIQAFFFSLLLIPKWIGIKSTLKKIKKNKKNTTKLCFPPADDIIFTHSHYFYIQMPGLRSATYPDITHLASFRTFFFLSLLPSWTDFFFF